MTSMRRLLPLLAVLLIWAGSGAARASSPDLPASLAAPSGVIIDEAGSRRKAIDSSTGSKEKTRGREPPASPVNLFTPDEFQFYTLNKDGQLVMKQMTKHEIQGMIAAGGGNTGGTNIPIDIGLHRPPQIPNGEPKVSDVVQNVQKVLKGELNKPVKVHTSGSSIPGSVNSQWTNMLPYILSGGSLDQQDVSQDSSILLSALDDDQTFVDVVPLQSIKPAEGQQEPEINSIPLQPIADDQGVKLVTLDPTKVETEKPIYLVGNMALDSGILGEHETYVLPTKGRPSRPTTTHTYNKFTTSLPPLVTFFKGPEKDSNQKNSSSDKPTLYIPVAVSPSILVDKQNQNNYNQPEEGLDIHTIAEYVSKPNPPVKNAIKFSTSENESSSVPLKKTPVYVASDSEFTRVPMIQVPVISADKISTTTQHTNQQQTPMFEILPTISPGSVTSSTVKEGPYISKINIGPIGGFKKPESSYKPQTSYRPVYEPITDQSTFVSASSSRPGYDSTTNILSSTYRPVYETRRPVYKPVSTKPSTANVLLSSTYRPVYEAGLESSTFTDKSSYRPIYDIYEASTRPNSGVKVTQTAHQTYTSQKNSSPDIHVIKPNYQDGIMKTTQYKTYTTGKATPPSFETVTKPSTQSDDKVTQYQTYTTKKASSPALEIVTKPSAQSGDKATQYQTYTTKKASSPVLEIVTKPSAQSGDKITQYQTYTTKKASSPVVEIVTKPSAQSEDKVTQYQTYTTKKASSPVVEIVTKPSAQSGDKVTQYQTYTNKKASSPALEIVTKPSAQSGPYKITDYQIYTPAKGSEYEVTSKPSTQNDGYKVTRYPTYTTRKVSSSVPEMITQPSIQSSETTVKSIPEQGFEKNDQLSFSQNGQVNKHNSLSTSSISKDDQTTVNPSTTYKSTEKNTEFSDVNKNTYSTEKINNVYYTTVPGDKSETVTTSYYVTEKPTQSFDSVTSNEKQPVKTEIYNKDEASTERSVTTTKLEESTKDNLFIPIEQKDALKDSETSPKQTTKSPDEVTETIIPGYDLKDLSDMLSSSTTKKSESNNEDTYYIKLPQKDSTEKSSSSYAIPNEEGTMHIMKPEHTSFSNEYEGTTQFIPANDDITEYYTVKYDKINNSENKPAINEEILNKEEEEDTYSSTSDKNTIQKIEQIDLTTDKSTSIQTITESQDNNKESEDNADQKEKFKPSSNAQEEIFSHVIPSTESGEFYTATSEKPGDENDKITLQDSTTESQNKQAHVKINEHKKRPIIKPSSFATESSATTGFKEIFGHSSKNPDPTPSYEKVDSMIENAPSKTKPDTSPQTTSSSQINTASKKKIPIQEDEVSTVKVIPIYDDDSSGYTSFDNPNETTLITSIDQSSAKDKTTPASNRTDKPVSQEESIVDSTSYSPSIPTAVSTSSATIDSTESNPNRETVLPGLEETFNNYMKEHYDPNLSTADNYDEISHLTTFPTMLIENASSNKNKQPSSLSSTTGDSMTDTTKHQTVHQKPESSESSVFETSDSESSTSFTAMNTLENISSTESEESKESITSTDSTEDSKDNIETPIIYLDLISPDSDAQSTLHQVTKDNMSNSSLTRIKIQNPIQDVDKILADAPPHTNTPSTVQYTLPSTNEGANNIASGLIAGYPTYSQEIPMTDFVPFSTMHTTEITSETKKSNLSKVEVQSKPQESDKISQKETTISYHEKPTTSLPSNDDKYAVKASSIPTSYLQDEATTYAYQTSENPNYESYTQIPFESLPIVNNTEITTESDETSFNPPLEKINDLINQLQNTPSDRDSIGYDYSNGIVTTIVPLDRFEMILNENNPTTTDETLTTIFDNLSKTSTESQNTTYVILQTLPTTSSKIEETSTEPVVQYTTTKKPSTTVTTTQNTKPSTNSTTILTIVKQTTGKPFITTTYSTTKGSLEKIQSTIDKSAGRINLEEEKNKIQQMKPTEPTRFTMKNKLHYSTVKRPSTEEYTYTRKITKPASKSTTVTIAEYLTPKPTVTTSVKDSSGEKWTLIPQKVVPDQGNSAETKKTSTSVKEGVQQMKPQIVPLDHSTGAIGLDQSSKGLDKDVAEFLSMCNELSFKFWTLANSGLSTARSVTMSPFGMVSTLAMIFLGARGLTSNQMNDILKLDDVVTFNPHLVFQNITDTVTLARGQGIENAAFVRALFADRLKVRRIMPFYKEQAQQFYEGAVVDINFSTAGDILRRRTNLLIRKQTGGRIKDFVKMHTVPLRSPLTALSANVFQTSCDSPDASSEGRDGEMYFAVAQTVKQRKLVPIPAVVWKSGVSAGYEPSLDATAVALGDPKRPVSLIMVMPGQQGVTAPGDNLERLEYRLFANPGDNALEKLLKVIIPRRVEVQMPKFSHRSIVNVTSALKRMGFDQLFSRSADLKGINGAGHDLYLADMLQMNLFCTCGDENKLGGRHMSETYPGTSSRHMRAWEIMNKLNNGVYDHLEIKTETASSESSESSKCDDEEENGENDWSGSESSSESNEDVDLVKKPLDLSFQRHFGKQKLNMSRLRWLMPNSGTRCRSRRQAEPEKPRMKMDKPFLYLIRHNLTGLILHIGRFNPKNQS